MTAPDPVVKPLDVEGLAEYLGMSVGWVKAQVAAGKIPHHKLPGGRVVRFTAEDIAEMFAAGKQSPRRPPTRAEVVRRIEDAGRRRRAG